MQFPENLDLLSVGIAISGTLVLGFAVYFTDRKSITNKTFFSFSLVTALWGLLNYLSYQVYNIDLAFWFLKSEIALGVWQAFFLFLLFYAFPARKMDLPRTFNLLLVPIVFFVSLISLTPLVFSGVKKLTEAGLIGTLTPGPAIIMFGLLSVSMVVAGLYALLRKIYHASSREEQNTLGWFFIGGIAMFSPIIILNFFLPAFFDNPTFVPFGAVSIFPFVLFTSYSILKHKLFNVKVTGVALLVFVLSVTAFGEVIFSRELSLIIYRSSVFILILSFGIVLIKGVLREVEQREKIEVLAKDLEEANKQQENLIHFITHQIKGFLTKSKYIFAELLDGDFGSINNDIKEMAQEGLKVNTDAVSTVQTILNAANIKTGRMKYDMNLLDLKELVEKVFEKYKKNAENKGLAYNLEIAPGTYGTEGDNNQLNEAFSNLIDNSIRYTPKGEVKVSLKRTNSQLRFSVKDTGIGISKEDIGKLFQEGQRGKDAIKVNVDSTGFGLYIVKNIIEAHHGKVWVESEGEGKGSEFVIELPAK